MKVDFERACSILRDGHALVFPTDTVVGIGVSVEHASGTGELFAAKRRPADKPVAWLVGGASALDAWGCNVPGYAYALAEAFWPGAVTLVVPSTHGVLTELNAGNGRGDRDGHGGRDAPALRTAAATQGAGTLGMRMPACACVLDLIEAVGSPLATTSANFSGSAAPSTLDELDPAFARGLPVLDARCDQPSAVASTVIDCTASSPRVLRAGTITASDIEEVLAHAD